MNQIITLSMAFACGLCNAEYAWNERKQLKHPLSDCRRSDRTWNQFNDNEPMEYIDDTHRYNVCGIRVREKVVEILTTK